METLSLALLSCALQNCGMLDSPDKFSTVVEIQFYCQVGLSVNPTLFCTCFRNVYSWQWMNDFCAQIADDEMLKCRAQINDFLRVYFSRPSKTPRLQLVWAVSSRTLRKMKPSTKVLSDLEPIMEDEDDEGGDGGRFDRSVSDYTHQNLLSSTFLSSVLTCTVLFCCW